MKTFSEFLVEVQLRSTRSNTVKGTKPTFNPGQKGGGSGVGGVTDNRFRKNRLVDRLGRAIGGAAKSGAGAIKDRLSKKGEDKPEAGQAKRDERTPAKDTKPGHSGPELKKLNPATKKQSVDIHREKQKMIGAGQPRNPNAIAPAKGGPTNKRLASAKKVNQLKGGQDQKALPAGR